MDNFLLDGSPGRTAFVKGKECLFFSGYAYLGVQHLPEFIALVKQGIDKFGWLHPSSRISNTRLALYEECEALLSAVTGCESSVLVSSGYTAGRMVVEKWQGSITNLQPSHPAIRAKNPPTPSGLYAVDSVDILASTITNIGTISNLSGVTTLIIDDSHGIGLTGINGAGAGSYVERADGVEYVFTYSLSKALGINAGAISCNATVAAAYRLMPAYTASTAPSPAQLYAFLKGQHIYEAQRNKLQYNIQYFKLLVQGLPSVLNHPSLPVFVLQGNINEEVLIDKNFIISSFAYPNPTGKKIHRVVLNALHTKNDLEQLAECLHECQDFKPMHGIG